MTTIDRLGGTEIVKDNDLIPIYKQANRRTRNVSAIDFAEYVNQSAAVVSVDGRTGEVTLTDVYAPILHVGSTGENQHGVVEDGGDAGFMSGAQSAKLTGIQAGAQNNTASNVGAGAELFKAKSESDLQFRTIASTATISAVVDGDTVRLDSNVIDSFSSEIVTIASASTVDLTGLVPLSGEITITGSATINSFTVEPGRAFVVVFTGSPTLVKGASIETGTDADIVAAAGDSCIIRSTAANTVQVAAGSFLAFKSVGIGQTWQNLTASRAFNTTYTNTTGRPIEIKVTGALITFGISLIVDGITIERITSQISSVVSYDGVSAIIPAGSTYRVEITLNSPALHIWAELRT